VVTPKTGPLAVRTGCWIAAASGHDNPVAQRKDRSGLCIKDSFSQQSGNGTAAQDRYPLRAAWGEARVSVIRAALRSVARGRGMRDLAYSKLVYGFHQLAVFVDYLDGLLALHFAS
jgi:hypothetical protein